MHDAIIPDIEAALAHDDFLRGLARSLIRGDAADDLVQDTYAAALAGGPGDPSRLKGWLASVMRRRAAMHWRRRGVESRHREHVARSADSAPAAEVVAKEEIRRAVVEAMLAVSEPSRSALVLRYYDGLAPREAAARLGVPVETLRTRTKRGLAAMRTHLDETQGGRRAWTGALAGAAGLGTAKVSTGSALGWIAVAVLVIGLGGGGLWLAADDPDDVPVLIDSTESDTPARASPEEQPGTGPTLRTVDRSGMPQRMPTGTARITGRVLHGASARAGSVAVWLLTDNTIMPWTALDRDHLVMKEEPARRAQATSAGFVVEHLPAGRFLLLYEDDAGGRFARLVAIRHPGLTVDGTLRLPADSQVLQLTAQYHDGRPFVGRVRVSQRDDEKGDATTAHLYVTTDAAGRATIQGLRVGTASLSVELPDETTVTSRLHLPDEAVFRMIVDRPTVTTSGIVVDAISGKPLAGATVNVSSRLDKSSAYESGTITHWRASRAYEVDAEGRFKIAFPHGDRLGVSASASGYRGSYKATDGGEELRIELQPAMLLTGRVVSKGTGTARAGMRVYAHAFNERVGSRIGPALTDTQGRFQIERPSGAKIMIYALGDGWCSEGVGRARARGFNPCIREAMPTSDDPLVLEVVPTARVQGSVRDRNGRAIEGAHVRLTRPDRWTRDEDPVLGRPDETATDAQGRYALEGVPPDTPWLLDVGGPGVLDFESEAFELEGGETKTLDVETFRRFVDRQLLLTVLASQDDKPIAGVGVSLDRIRPRGYERIARFARTDENGQVRVGPLTDAPMGLRLSSPEVRRQGDRPIAFEPADDPETKLTLRVERVPVIRGRVILPEGARAFFADVRAYPPRELDGARPSGDDPAADGTFTIAVKGEAPWRVVATVHHRGQHLKAEAEVRPGTTDLVLDLAARAKPAATTAIETEDEPETTPWVFTIVGHDGEPVPHATFRRISSRGASTWGPLPADGRITVNLHPASDPFGIEVFDARDKRGGRLPYGAIVAGPFQPGAGEDATLRMAQEKQIAGMVRIDGKPAPKGVEVAAYPVFAGALEGWASTRSQANGYTDDAGRFVVKGLGDVAYTLKVQGPQAFLPAPAPVVAAGTRGTVIEHRAPVEKVVTITDGVGRPVAGASIRWSNPDSKERRTYSPFDEKVAYTDEQGRARVKGLDPRVAYALSLHGPRGGGYFDRDIEAWSPAVSTFTLERSLSVSGTVTLPDGRPFAEAHVTARAEAANGGWGSGRTDAKGRFTVQGLKPGLVKVRAVHGRMRTEEFVVNAGASDLRLELERGVHVRARVAEWPREGLTSVPYRMVAAPPRGSDIGNSRGGSGLDRRGTLDMPGQVPGSRIAIRVGPLPDGRIGWISDVEAEGESVDVVIPLVEAGAIEGRVEGIQGDPRHTWVAISHGTGRWAMYWHGRPDANGNFRVEGLPPIELTVQVVRRGEGKERFKSEAIKSRPGAKLELKAP